MTEERVPGAAMLRRSAQGSTNPERGAAAAGPHVKAAAEPAWRVGETPAPRRVDARAMIALARLVLAPFAALAAAVAGAIFLVLLPVCGIASIAEGFARVCWDAVRRALPHPGRGATSHR